MLPYPKIQYKETGMEKLDFGDLLEPGKTKKRLIDIHYLIAVEGGSYLWIIFFCFVVGVFLDFGFYEVPITLLQYKLLLILFGGILSVGMSWRIVYHEPKIEAKKTEQKKYVDAYNKRKDEFDEHQSKDFEGIESSFRYFITMLANNGLWKESEEKGVLSDVTKSREDIQNKLTDFRKEYFKGVKSNVTTP